nr:hypothetical protein [Tanacetum cinerariifolium]
MKKRADESAANELDCHAHINSNSHSNSISNKWEGEMHTVTPLPRVKGLPERPSEGAGSVTFRHGDEATRARIRKNKEAVKCFKCHGTGHFANTCPRDDTETMQKQEKETTATIPSLPEPKFEDDFEELAKVLGLERSDGLDI